MFTNNLIKLSHYDKQFDLTVLRDCSFSYAAKIPTLLNLRIVPCSTEKHISQLSDYVGIVGVITLSSLQHLVPIHLGLAISADPVAASLHLHEAIASMDGFQWIDFDTRIDPSAKIHKNAIIESKNVIVGKNTSIGPGTYVKERTIIGDNCNIGEGVVVGLDALEIFEAARPRRILLQSGGVKINNNVTILSKCTVVRATFGGFTNIGEESILDVLIHVAHDVQIGKRVTVIACAEISGRCELDDDSYVGPNACIRNGVKIGKKSTVSMGAVVTQDVPDGVTVSGNFAVEHSKWLQFIKNL